MLEVHNRSLYFGFGEKNLKWESGRTGDDRDLDVGVHDLRCFGAVTPGIGCFSGQRQVALPVAVDVHGALHLRVEDEQHDADHGI